MKILLGDKEYEAKLDVLAVEKIEDKYDLSLEELFSKGKLRARDYAFIMWASIKDAPAFDEAMVLLAYSYTYVEMIDKVNSLIGVDPNAKRADIAPN